MKNAITGKAIILISHANVHAARLVTGRNHPLANKWRSKWSPKWSPTGDPGLAFVDRGCSPVLAWPEPPAIILIKSMRYDND
jgi:hypothetical protein